MDPPKHRVAVFSSEYPPHVYGGLGTHVREITAALAGPVEFDIYVPTQGDYAQRPPRVSVQEVPVATGGNNVELWLHYCKAAVDAAVRTPLAVDLLHCHDWMTVIAGIKLREVFGKPLVFNVHLPQVVESYQSLEQLGLVYADLVLVNSRAVEQEIRDRRLPLRRLEVVPNGVNLQTFSPAPVQSQGSGQILFIGRLVPQKGIAVLLQAFKAVLGRYPESKLVIAGDGELELFLKRTTRYLGIPHRVSFVNWQTGEALVDLYRQSEFVVIPSYYEPFGIVALEAMACGCPVIASRTGGLAEIITDGVNGYLVSVGDYLQLAQRMVNLLQDKPRRESMGQAARKRAAEFSWQKTAAQTLNLYDRLVSDQKGSGLSTVNPKLTGSILKKLDQDSRRMVMSILN